jgi:hypothetical protein
MGPDWRRVSWAVDCPAAKRARKSVVISERMASFRVQVRACAAGRVS